MMRESRCPVFSLSDIYTVRKMHTLNSALRPMERAVTHRTARFVGNVLQLPQHRHAKFATTGQRMKAKENVDVQKIVTPYIQQRFSSGSQMQRNRVLRYRAAQYANEHLRT